MELLRRVGLPCAPWRSEHLPLSVVKSLTASHSLPTLPDHRLAQFATRYADDFLMNIQPLQPMQPSDPAWINVLLGIYVFDIWAGHVDRRECLVGICRSNGTCLPLPIDNGHLFFGPFERRISAELNSALCVPHAIQRLVETQRYDKLLARWVEIMQRNLPEAITEIELPIDREWGTNNLFVNRQIFSKRIFALDRLVREHRRMLREQSNHQFAAA